jgi:hypothetical protein
MRPRRSFPSVLLPGSDSRAEHVCLRAAGGAGLRMSWFGHRSRPTGRAGLLPRTAIACGMLVVASTALGQRPDRDAASRGPSKPASAATRLVGPPAPDYRLAVLYERSDPLFTFQFRVYNVHKGEYTPEVDAWLATIEKQYPRYHAYVRDIALKDEPDGNSPERAVASAVLREHLAVAGPGQGLGIRDTYGIFGRGASSGLDLGAGREPRGTARMRSRPGTNNVSGLSAPPGSMQPPAYPFPNPFPYPRPHP